MFRILPIFCVFLYNVDFEPYHTCISFGESNTSKGECTVSPIDPILSANPKKNSSYFLSVTLGWQTFLLYLRWNWQERKELCPELTWILLTRYRALFGPHDEGKSFLLDFQTSWAAEMCWVEFSKLCVKRWFLSKLKKILWRISRGGYHMVSCYQTDILESK